MTTVRQLERLWKDQSYGTLVKDLITARTEGTVPSVREELSSEATKSAVAAALGIIRLAELDQAHVPLFSKLIRRVLELQETDGGWGDAMTTATCLRALCTSRGEGPAIDRGIAYLAALQQPAGVWPRIPIRRIQSDAAVSAYVLMQLGGESRFTNAVRLKDALAWFENHQSELDADARTLWQHAKRRCRLATFNRAVVPGLFMS